MQTYDLTFKFVEVSQDNSIHVALMIDEHKDVKASYVKALLKNRHASDEEINRLFSEMLIHQRKVMLWIPLNHGVMGCILEIHKDYGLVAKNSVD